jgi:hypothetical protein
MRKCLNVFLSVFFTLILFLPGSAEPIDTIGGKQSSQLTVMVDTLESLLKQVKIKRTSWSMTVQASYNDDNAGDSTVSTLFASTKIIKGGYPREFRFTTKSSFRFANDDLEDRVTAMLLNYDYYLRPKTEIYSFIERFSDSYLSIEERFEIGIGVKFEFPFMDLVNPKTYNRIDSLFTAVDKIPRGKYLSEKQYQDMKMEKDMSLTYLEKKERRLNCGLAFSIFRELERPDEIRIPEMDTTVTPESEQCYRFVIRPSFVLRATSELTLSGECYYKLPLSSPHEVNDHLDYRVYAYLISALSLSKDKHDNDKVGLVVSYFYWHDNVPPFVELNGIYAAKKTHRRVVMGIEVKI